MTCRGHVQNGIVVLDDPTILPDGAEVEITVRQNGRGSETHGQVPGTSEAHHPSVEEEITRIVADDPTTQWERLPPDLNEQLDHYVYGTPKR